MVSGKCPLCNDTGWEMFVEDGYEFYRDCSNGCRMKQVQGLRLKFANIPETYKDCNFTNFKSSYYMQAGQQGSYMATLKTVNDWLRNLDACEEQGLGLYIWSEIKGSGKTRLICSIANELMSDIYKRQVKFCTSTQILDEIRATYGDSGSNESTLVNDLCSVPFLIIDDFGTEKLTDWVNEKLFSIINQRYQSRKVTLFTSNYSIDELKCDERVKDRILEVSYEIHFCEVSVRKAIANKRKGDNEQKKETTDSKKSE